MQSQATLKININKAQEQVRYYQSIGLNPVRAIAALANMEKELASMTAPKEVEAPVEIKTRTNKGMNAEQITIKAEQEKLLAINRATNAAIMSGKFPQNIVAQMQRNVERNSQRLDFLFKSFLAARNPYRTTRMSKVA